jgi:hypothetical protein
VSKAIIGGVIVLVLAAIAGAGFYLMQNVDGIVKELIEEAGTDSVGTAVKVAGVKVNLREGTAVISGLTVANPAGFSPEPLLMLATIRVAVDTASLTKDVYIIKDVVVEGVRVLAEQKGSGTNVQALVDGMPEDDAGASESGGGSADETRLAVEQINVAAGQMELRSEQFGAREIELTSIRLTNLGSAEKGLTTAELSDAVSDQLLGQIKTAVAKAASAYLQDEAKARLKEKLGEKFGNLFK